MARGPGDTAEHDLRFRAMGCDVRILAGPSTDGKGPSPADAADQVRQMIESFDARLSRFRPDSELSQLNSDQRTDAEVSGLLASMISAATWAARESGGLVDPTLVDQLEDAGYAGTFDESERAPLDEALQAAPERRPARANPASRWHEIRIRGARVTRPADLRIDSGGVGKGLAADTAAVLLGDRSRFCVSAGGDIRIGGPDAESVPYPVMIDDPFGGDPIVTLQIAGGGLATSGIGSRIWRNPDGSFGHHLINPATGAPAWTGLVQVTALAPTTLEAETLAKRALLTGPGGLGLLERWGGVVVHDDCKVELIGRVAELATRPRLGELQVVA